MVRILIVDDNDDIREATAELLRLAGYEVVSTGRVDDVLPHLDLYVPDLLLQDCHMAGLDLARLIASIRRRPRFQKLPILLFTASIDSDEFWPSVGADGLLRKPFEMSELRDHIQRFVGQTPRARSG